MSDEPDSSRALVVAPPAGDRPRLKFADSIADKRPGEIILLDRHGELVSKRRFRRRQRITLAVTGALVVTLAIVSGATALFAPVIGGATGGFYVYLRYRKFREALALIAEWRNDEAQALLDQIRGARGAYKCEIHRLQGVLAWRRGDLTGALDHTERGLLLARRSQKPSVRYWMLLMHKIELLVELDLEHARRLVPELDAAPTAEYFTSERRYIALSIAMRADQHELLPDDDTLYDWARAALADNNGGFRLGLLAWAFDRRGDRDMSDHLAREVTSHLPMPFAQMEAIAPSLYRWLAPRIASLPALEE